jgi:AcrR family transcriptional regulator
VEAARRLIAERGPETLTVSAVARAAEINRTTAYQHFRTRDDLLHAVTAELTAEVAALLAEPGPIAERIDRIALYFVDHVEMARLALHQLLAESPFPRESWSTYVLEMQHLAETGGIQEGVDPDMLAQVLMAVAILWPLNARLDSENEADARAATQRFTRELKRLLLYGVFRPEAWPDLVASITEEPGAGRGRREP